MATQHTRKKHPFDTRSVAKRLDTMLDSVVQRGVYIIRRSGPQHYGVINTKTGKILVDQIPLKKFAEQVCNKLNQIKLRFNADYYATATRKFAQYRKLLNDCVCYTHTLDHSKDAYLQTATRARLSECRTSMEQILRSLRPLM